MQCEADLDMKDAWIFLLVYAPEVSRSELLLNVPSVDLKGKQSIECASRSSDSCLPTAWDQSIYPSLLRARKWGVGESSPWVTFRGTAQSRGLSALQERMLTYLQGFQSRWLGRALPWGQTQPLFSNLIPTSLLSTLCLHLVESPWRK